MKYSIYDPTAGPNEQCILQNATLEQVKEKLRPSLYFSDDGPALWDHVLIYNGEELIEVSSIFTEEEAKSAGGYVSDYPSECHARNVHE